MCLGTVVVTRPSAPAVEVSDVVELTFDDAAAHLRTLFGEAHSFPGVAIRQIDMRRGVVITLSEEPLS